MVADTNCSLGYEVMDVNDIPPIHIWYDQKLNEGGNSSKSSPSILLLDNSPYASEYSFSALFQLF
jgi:hypothetical protein